MNILSIDIGGTNTKYGIFHIDGNNATLAFSGSFKTPHLLDNLCEILVTKLKEHHFEMIAVGIPGVYDFNNDQVIYAPNLPIFHHLHLKERLKAHFNCEVLIENDGNMAAIGEYFFIEKEPLDAFVFITLGTGVGGGVIYQNEVLKGKTTISEIGHIIINFNGRRCGCGNLGCFEAYCGMNGIIETYKEISGVRVNNADEVFKKYETKDTLANIAIDLFSYHLASGLASIANIFSPAKIKIGGGVSFYQQFYFKKTVKYFSKMIFPAFKHNVIIAVSDLKNNAGLYGGAALCIKNR
jgi:glucokinase